ncbi:hypothetical protein M3Y14_33060 (plasmid) [Bacillus thuringiensis]|uniref:hypothetical protein n=1 Tax=Bacillus thuringiensis TaxID=1428 RepID=UPI00222445B3|nr:hypothetical protein [Bacillus thuringiensis]UYX55994.1 hypothetical protein M3Y14_33060 [Bacillus thuringiensis]
MKEVNLNTIYPSIRKLLSFATSDFKVEKEYEKYLKLLNRKLYSFELEGEIVGCMGIEINSSPILIFFLLYKKYPIE